MKEIIIYEKRFTKAELTILRMVVEDYLRDNPDDEEVLELYSNELGYNHPNYIK